ncbi:MAG: hypothetical protein ACK4KV_19200, partial [Rhodocyclaceae bacterium]
PLVAASMNLVTFVHRQLVVVFSHAHTLPNSGCCTSFWSPPLERLTEAERLQLVTSAEEVYQHIHDPWNLDDVYARDAIFDYILRPSAELIRRHEAHQARMVSEFEKGSTEH